MNTERRETINNFLSVYKAAIFDAEGVLFDTPEIYFQTHRKMAAELTGYSFTVEDQKELAGIPKKKGVKSVELFADKIGLSISANHRELAIERLMAKRDSLFMEILRESGQSLVKPGVAELLDVLGEKGIFLALSTSSSSRQLEALFTSQDIIKRSTFRVVVCADDNSEYAATRDKAVLNNAVIERFRQFESQITHSNCMMFEDSTEGVSAAKRSGIGLIIAVPDDHSRHLATAEGGRFGFTDSSLIIQDLEYFTKLIS